MAIVSGVRSTNSPGSGVRKYDHSDKLWMVDAGEAVLAFLARQLKKKETVDPEFRWFEKSSPARFTQVNDGAGYLIGATTITVDDGTIFRPGHIIQNVVTGEQMLVASATSTTVTVTGGRGYGTTAAAAGSDNQVLVILGNASAEGSTSPTALTSQASLKSNYIQTLRESFYVTGTEDATELYTGNDMTQLRMEHARLHKLDIERTSFFGEKKEDLTGSTPRRTTQGVNKFITTNRTDAGGALTEVEFETFIRNAFAKGGNKKLGFFSPLIASAVNAWAGAKLQMFPKDKTYGIAISNYLSIHGEISFVLERMFAENSTWAGMGFLLDLDKIVYRHMKGRDMRLLKNRQANDEDAVKEEYMTDMGIELADEACHSVLYGVTSYS